MAENKGRIATDLSLGDKGSLPRGRGIIDFQALLGIGCLLIFDAILKVINPLKSRIPHSLLGMCLVVLIGVYLRYHRPEEYNRVIHAATPAMNFITHRYLALFYSPALVTLPLTLWRVLDAKDIVLSGIVILIGCLMTAVCTSYSIYYVRRWTSNTSAIPYSEEKEDVTFSNEFVLIWVTAAMVSTLATMWCVGVTDVQPFFKHACIFVAQLSVTVCGYILGVSMPKRVTKWIQPMIFCAAMPNVWSILLSHPLVSKYSYDDWIGYYLPSDGMGAGRFLFFFLGPIIICFGFGIVEKWHILLQHKVEVILCCFVSAGFTMVSTGFLSGVIFHVDERVGRSLLSRGMTLALALENTKSFGGVPEVTAGAVAVTGLVGSNFICLFLDLMGFSDVIVRGITASAVAHGLGAAVMGSSEPDALAYAGLGYLMCGVSGILFTSMFSGILIRLVA